MVGNKFKTAASKLLAQHSAKHGGRATFATQQVKQQPMPAPPPVETRQEPLMYNREPLDRSWGNSGPMAGPMPGATSNPMSNPMSGSTASMHGTHPVILQQRIHEDSDSRHDDMVSSLIKYIIVIVTALIGWGVVALFGIETNLGSAGNIALGLVVGAAVGLVVTKDF